VKQFSRFILGLKKQEPNRREQRSQLVSANVMAKRKKKPTEPEYAFLTIEVNDYSARVDTSISYEVRDARHHQDDAKVYEFASDIELQGICTSPKDRSGERYALTIHGSEPRQGEFALTLADCHVRSDSGVPKYQKARGKEVPVYQVPRGIGLLQRQRRAGSWTGWAWVSPQTVTDMLTLLPHVRPLYVAIHEVKVQRACWIVSLTLQTTDPVSE
jgi:hypothetical protein